MLAAIEKPQTRRVLISKETDEKPEVSVNLRGLNATDLAFLINEHEEIMVLIFGGGLAEKGAQAIGKELLVRFPAFAYLCIALAADEAEMADRVAFLPLPLQVEMLSHVVELTMPDGVKEGTKKLSAAISRLLK